MIMFSLPLWLLQDQGQMNVRKNRASINRISRILHQGVTGWVLKKIWVYGLRYRGWIVGERSELRRWKGGMNIKFSFCFLLLDSGQNLIITALFWSLTLARQKGRGRDFMSHVFIKCFTKSVSLSKPASRVWDKNLCVGEGRRESWSIIWLFTTVRAKAASYWTLLGAM